MRRRSFVKRIGGIAAGSALLAGTTSAEPSQVNESDTQRYLVDTGSRATRRDRIQAERRGLEVIHRLPTVGLLAVRGRRQDVKRLRYRFARDVRVSHEPPLEHDGAAPEAAETTIDEENYVLQWDKEAMGVPDVHETTTGQGARISIIDSGIYAPHDDLQANVNTSASANFTADGFNHLPGHDPTSGDHGTHVAGIAAASDTGTTGVVGVAPDAELINCRVFPRGEALASFGDIFTAEAYSGGLPVFSRFGSSGEIAFGQLKEPADVANMSLGALISNVDSGLRRFLIENHRPIVRQGRQNGTLYTASSGNDGVTTDSNTYSIPAGSPYVMSVSATGPIGYGWDADGDGSITDLESPPTTPAFYSNVGPTIDIAGPGGNAALPPSRRKGNWFWDLVYSTVVDTGGSKNTQSWSWKAGTSMSAPNVAGVAALVRSVAPNLRTRRLERVLKTTADNTSQLTRRSHGGGFVNPNQAVQRVQDRRSSGRRRERRS